MAGNLNSADEEGITAINITPLVDVVLVLLIIFMATATLIVNPGIPVDLPRSRSGEALAAKVHRVVLTPKGELYFDSERVDERNLTTKLRDLASRDPEGGIVLGADRAVPYERVIRLVDLVRGAGIRQMSLMVSETTP
ncbi:MAG: biopolymer transporter ExbD [Candidatus Tectomicrobia bacterium]|uniref:Biopolymer transporter ExbD n=1 Tax=Tectimicrobiota bacterium TaxID=2528274 RepID=A0A932GQU0_UNCTE|nr:biopolymer transporter ExbD [Candidatus Tectomicrobia bacterium]